MAIAALPNLKTVIFLCVFMSATSILAKPVKYCDKKGNYAVKVKGVDIKPEPVRPGKEAVFSISASTGEEISGGDVVIDVAYFGIPVHSETIDLCKETPCPIPSGDFVLSHKQTLPIITPPGSYTLKMRMKNSNKSLLTCMTFGFKVGYGSSISDI